MAEHDDVIPGSLKRSDSYHSDYGNKTYREIKELAAADPPDLKARQMKKLIEQVVRLHKKREGAAVMSDFRGFKQKLAAISRLWEKKDFDAALAQVE